MTINDAIDILSEYDQFISEMSAEVGMSAHAAGWDGTDAANAWIAARETPREVLVARKIVQARWARQQQEWITAGYTQPNELTYDTAIDLTGDIPF